MPVIQRPIRNREERPNRVFGCTFGEWAAIVAPAFALLMYRPPFLFDVTVMVIDLLLVLYVGRRYPSNAVSDLLAHASDIVRFGGRAFAPDAHDATLRRGSRRKG